MFLFFGGKYYICYSRIIQEFFQHSHLCGPIKLVHETHIMASFMLHWVPNGCMNRLHVVMSFIRFNDFKIYVDFIKIRHLLRPIYDFVRSAFLKLQEVPKNAVGSCRVNNHQETNSAIRNEASLVIDWLVDLVYK